MKNKNIIIYAIIWVTIFSLILSGCNFPASFAKSSGSGTGSTENGSTLVTADPNSALTATPFQPINPTSTIMPTQISTPDPELVGIDADTQSYANKLQRPDGQVNILLLGSDYRPMSGYRTDVIMLVSLNTITGTASVTSFPRDLYVYIPGWEMNRINTAQAHGGFELTVQTFEYNFGVTPDFYIMTNFDGFKGIIDTLGGIDINASKSLSDKCDLPQAVYDYCNVDVGANHFDGATALWYVRARYSTSDFDRLRRAQEVMQGVFAKLISLNGISRASELYDLFKSSVETNMGLTDMLKLLPLASKLSDTSTVQRYAVSQDFVTSWTTPGGGAVLLPNQELIWTDIITKAVYGQ